MRILWLKTELLHPVDKGGRIRTYQMLRCLKREHHVTYLTLHDGAAAADAETLASEYCHDLIVIPHVSAAKGGGRFYGELAANLISSLPYAIEKYESPAMRDAISRFKGADVIVCDFLAPAVNLPPGLDTPVVLFQHNVEAVIWRRHAEVRTNPVAKVYFREQWQRMCRFEEEVCRTVAGVITVSTNDSETIRRDYGVQCLGDVPTGVDTEYFHAVSGQRRAGHLVFTGSMDWLPNDDAIRFFLDEVFPRIRRKTPAAHLTVVGRNPGNWLVARGREDSSVTVTGRVDDVRPYISAASCYVVPIRIGGGTRLKIYEGMAMDCPVVSTTIGAEGLPLVPGQEILIADEPAAMADAIVTVLNDDRLASELGARGGARVRADFAWPRVAERFADLCQLALPKRRESVLVAQAVQ
ncbi:MAG: glycosyltransferase [Vicinamibacterales bacterium]